MDKVIETPVSVDQNVLVSFTVDFGLSYCPLTTRKSRAGFLIEE